jgi:hypothetical protein
VEKEISASRRHYTVTNPIIRAQHKLTVRKPYLCECGEEFDSYNEYLKHRTTVSAIKGKTDD